MKFSLIMGTLGRTDEVRRFLVSLDAQSHRDFELIVVDQNPDGRLAGLIAQFAARFPVLHLRCAPGLSRARNVGLQHVSGQLVAFPDDDCWYPPDLLAFVAARLEHDSGCDGVTGRSVDEHGRDSALKFSSEARLIDRFSVWSNAISYTIFLRRAVVDKIGPFDEALGVGAGTIFGSGEETDYVLRAVEAGFHLQFAPALRVHHPQPWTVIDQRDATRAYVYGCGMGRVLNKHDYPLWFKARMLLRPLIAGLMHGARLDRARASLHLHRCAGRLRGLRATP
jgi:glycosyltransferase involved in cell wall biosynthesis